MTYQARKVIDTCGFPLSDTHQIEKLICRFYPNQIINLVRAKDKGGDQESIEWFLPFFNGYVHPTMNIEIGESELFWSTYDRISGFVQDFDAELLPLIIEMAMDLDKLEVAIKKSKPYFRYVYLVYSGLPDIEKKTFNTVNVEIKRHKVVTTELE